MARIDAYRIITDRMIEKLEKGTVPWHKPWGGPQLHPKNLNSGKPYRGINVFTLASENYGSPYWLTFKQARGRGGHVKKGEKGSPCIFWNWFEKANPESEEPDKIPFLKYYTVFNVEQCEEIEYPETGLVIRDHQPIAACENLVGRIRDPPAIKIGGSRSCYDPKGDTIHIPRREHFDSPESYYCVLFHELVHSTGHEKRLARTGITGTIRKNSRKHTEEELVAEMGAAYLCGQTGIEKKVIDNSASYIASWIGRLRDDKKLVIVAAGHAQKAADYLMGETGRYKPK